MVDKSAVDISIQIIQFIKCDASLDYFRVSIKIDSNIWNTDD